MAFQGHRDRKTGLCSCWLADFSALSTSLCEVTPARAKDIPGETGDAERKGEGEQELEGERREEDVQREVRVCRHGDGDGPQRPWRPLWNVHPGGLDSVQTSKCPLWALRTCLAATVFPWVLQRCPTASLCPQHWCLHSEVKTTGKEVLSPF